MSLPKTMNAAGFTKTGGPEVVEVLQVDTPQPKENQVLIKTEWAGINFIDTYHRGGVYPIQLPFILGQEAAGTVAAVGPGVTDLKVNDKVAAYGGQSLAEYVVRQRNNVVKVPTDTRLAAASLVQGLTAWTLVRESYEVKKGDWVLVHAAAGGVGLLLCQMCKHLGAHVIGTVSTPEKAELAKQNGAEHVIFYTKESVVDGVKRLVPDGVHAVFDGVGKATWEDDFQVVRRKGTIVTYGNSSGTVDPFPPLKLAGKNVKVLRPTLINYIYTQEEMETYSAELFDLIHKGIVKVRVHDEYPFTAEGVRKAHVDISGRGTTGKLIVKVA